MELHIYQECKPIWRLLGILTTVTMAVVVLPHPKALVLYILQIWKSQSAHDSTTLL